MRKILLLIAFIFCICSAGYAQDSYEPKLLILSPAIVSVEPSLQNEANAVTASLKSQFESRSSSMEDSSQPENILLMKKSTLSLAKDISFDKQIPLLTQGYLTYKFYEKFTNCLLLVSDKKTEGKLADMQQIAKEANVTYVVNFPKAAFYKQNGLAYCKLQVQLYDGQSNTILFDKEYTGDFNNPGFEFTCEQGTIGCTINNSLSGALDNILRNVAMTNPTIQRERQIAQERAAYIQARVYPQKFNASIVKKVVASNADNINTDKMYQCLYNTDSTKFVAFFLETISKKDSKPLLSDKKDMNVKILTSKDIHDKGYLDETPKTYAYIVKGIKFEGKWYYKKTEATYFDASNVEEGKLEYLNNLQGWDYFADNSTAAGNFWEGVLFKKIEDRRKGPDWEKRKRMLESEERENRDYVGLYELVADTRKKEDEAIRNAYNDKIRNEVLLPFYNKQIKNKANHIAKLNEGTKYFTLIYSKNKEAIINPIKVADEKGVISIRYFVLIPNTNQIYEWTLVKPNILKEGEYADNPVNNTMGSVTQWTYAYKTLDDDAFWKEKVLLKEGDNFKYLKKL
ncbi:MAG: hypothetical protein V4456_14675 [Bacteroidota bacterium]